MAAWPAGRSTGAGAGLAECAGAECVTAGGAIAALLPAFEPAMPAMMRMLIPATHRYAPTSPMTDSAERLRLARLAALFETWPCIQLRPAWTVLPVIWLRTGSAVVASFALGLLVVTHCVAFRCGLRRPACLAGAGTASALSQIHGAP